MKLRDWPEFELIRPAGANRLIVGSSPFKVIKKSLYQWFGQFWFSS